MDVPRRHGLQLMSHRFVLGRHLRQLRTARCKLCLHLRLCNSRQLEPAVAPRTRTPLRGAPCGQVCLLVLLGEDVKPDGGTVVGVLLLRESASGRAGKPQRSKDRWTHFALRTPSSEKRQGLAPRALSHLRRRPQVWWRTP